VKSRLHEARRRLAADPALGALAMFAGDADADAAVDASVGAVAGKEAGS
jgi:hypothetical protein